jgi:uncharacterized membrane protein YdfJ with MMPL/SSD domain
MKLHQYADAMRLSRRLKTNSAVVIIAVCAVRIGSLIVTLHAEQTLVSRITASMAVALENPRR